MTLARRADEVGADAAARRARLGDLEPLLAVGGQAFTLRGPHATYEDLFLPLYGGVRGGERRPRASSRSRR